MSVARLFLIDAHAMCYRSYFAIKGLSTSKGQATNAVYGFVTTLQKILRDHGPQYMAVCFDVGKKTLRQEKFADYKIQRPSMPEDLVSQIPIIKEAVAAYRVPVLEKEGYEADDVIASIARSAAARGTEVVIVSDDKDMFQLVNDRVRVLSVRREKLIGPTEVKEILGVEPSAVPDLIALAGDSSDNIPGVKGIGEVTAKKLIASYGNLSAIYEHLEDISSASVRDKLTADKKTAFLSRELAVLSEEVDVEIDLEKMKVRDPDAAKLFDLFSRLEFRKLASEVAVPTQGPEVEVTVLTGDAIWPALNVAVRASGRMFIFSPEADEEGTLYPPDVFFASADKVFQVPVSGLDKAGGILSDAAIEKIVWDYKAILKTFSRAGCSVQGPVFDVLLAGYLLSPGKAAYDLRSLAWEYLKLALPEQMEGARAVTLLEPLFDRLKPELTARGMDDLLRQIEIPLSAVLFKMEREGVCLDKGILSELSMECEAKMEALTRRLFRAAGEEFNLNSPKQLGHILFEKMKLPVIKRTKTGFSTDEEVLSKLAVGHPFAADILEYRQLSKLKSTYLDALPKLVHPETHRIHASFHQTGAETGRLSSSDPNLQNIPIRTELGRRIRRAFVPSGPDRWIVAADYSQIELRILAHLSEDANLIRAFREGQDIHQFTAAQIFEVGEADVTLEMRNTAKRVNFGIIYGMSAFGLSKDLGISQPEAQEFIDKYFLRYPGVKTFMDDRIKECKKNGFVVTLFHRRRYIPEIASPNVGLRQFAERQAINTPVQGSAADLIKIAMIRVQEALEMGGLDSRMIITVHDELVFDMPSREEERLVTLIRDRMESAVTLKVPIEVTVKKGLNWLETEKLALTKQ